MAQAPNLRRDIARQQDEQIANNVAKIEDEKARKQKSATALDLMASRLNISPGNLQNTLMNTVFKGASAEEFAALVVVAQSYGLNPLTKEIYAFPQKGGGIVPVVGIDGWLRIMNEHPQFDSIEFTDIPDESGRLSAIEAAIYRKDRSRPIKIVEYLEECKRNTDPWNKSPARMLRHRATIQCARYAFGFSGLTDENDVERGEITLGGNTSPAPMRDVTQRKALPTQTATTDDGTAYNTETGEVVDQPSAQSGQGADQVQGERKADEDAGAADLLIEEIRAKTTIVDLKNWRRQYDDNVEALREDQRDRVNKAYDDQGQKLAGK